MVKMRKKILILFLVLITGLACSATSNLLGGNNVNTNSGDSLSNDNGSVDTGASQPGPDSINLSEPSLFEVAENSNSEIDMLMAFEGQDDSGASVFGQIHLSGTISNDLPGAFIELTMEGDAAFDGVSYLVMADLPTTDYFYTADTGCLSFGNNEFENPYNDFMQTAEFEGNAQKIESNVIINGYQTDKYLLTIENIPEDSFESNEMVELYESFVYVTQGDEFIVQVELNWLGTNEALTGSTTLLGNNAAVYSFLPLSGPVDISPPAECNVSEDTGMVDSSFPVLSDATGISSLGPNLIQYTTETGVEDIVAFYETEMAALGYTIDQSINYGEAAFALFSLDGKQVGLTVIKVDGDENYTVNIGGQ
jgi:hypothetical protein